MEHRLWGVRASVVVASRLSSLIVVPGLSCFTAYTIFLDQRLNPCLSLAGGFFTAEPPGQFLFSILLLQYCLLAGHLTVNSAYLSCQ